MDRESVSSSLLESVGYDAEEEILEVELQGGKVYQYMDAPEELYCGLLEADSLGRYYNHHVRGLSYTRVR